MTNNKADDYRRAIQRQADGPDSKVLVEASDLRELLDCWEWYTQKRPRIRKQAKTAASADWIETRFNEVK